MSYGEASDQWAGLGLLVYLCTNVNADLANPAFLSALLLPRPPSILTPFPCTITCCKAKRWMTRLQCRRVASVPGHVSFKPFSANGTNRPSHTVGPAWCLDHSRRSFAAHHPHQTYQVLSTIDVAHSSPLATPEDLYCFRRFYMMLIRDPTPFLKPDTYGGLDRRMSASVL